MNHEIKFKAWDKQRKKIFEVSNLGFNTVERDIMVSVQDHHYQGRGYIDNYELMQYTGLKDVNGIEIFEGDIVKNNFMCPEITKKKSNIGVIEWTDGNYMLYCKEEDRYTYLTCHITNKEFEVLGNIYANPELLEESE